MNKTECRVKELELALEKIRDEILYKPEGKARNRRILKRIDKIFGGHIAHWLRAKWLRDRGSQRTC